MSVLGSAMTDSRLSEQRAALRTLLLRPMITLAGDRDAFLLVRKHADALQEWLDTHVGWRLSVDPAVARLHKRTTRPDDGTRGLQDHRKTPFTRRRYVVFALALAALERSSAQTTLGRLAEDVVSAMADPRFAAAGVAFGLGTREERSDMVAVARRLIDLGILSLVAGNERAFLDNSGDALYDIERRALAALLATSVGPSTVLVAGSAERLDAVLEQPSTGTPELRNRALSQSLLRRLLDDPVLYYDELDEAELAYLVSQRRRLTTLVADATGLVAEIRAEGIAMVDPEDQLSDVRMPESGSAGHLTLLLAERIARTDGIPLEDLPGVAAELIREHGGAWSRAAREPGAERDLARDALERLLRLALVRLDGAVVRPRPAIARYAVGTPVIASRRPLPAPELELDFS